MIRIIVVLLAVIVGLLIYIGRANIHIWICHRTGNFTVFRVVFPDGRYGDFVACTEASRNTLLARIESSKRFGAPFTAGGPVVSYTVINGKDHDGQWMGRISN